MNTTIFDDADFDYRNGTEDKTPKTSNKIDVKPSKSNNISNKLPPLFPKLPTLTPRKTELESRDYENIQPILPSSHTATLLPRILPIKPEPLRPITPKPIAKVIPSPSFLPYKNKVEPAYTKPKIRPPSPIRATTPVNQEGLSYSKHRTWLVWSIISVILFFPIFFFWIPALVYSLRARKFFRGAYFTQGTKAAYLALIFNISTAILCLAVYAIVIIIYFTVIDQDTTTTTTTSSIPTLTYLCTDTDIDCYFYCRQEFSAYTFNAVVYSQYWTCYSTYQNYVDYTNDDRWLYCIQAIVESYQRYICRSTTSFLIP